MVIFDKVELIDEGNGIALQCHVDTNKPWNVVPDNEVFIRRISIDTQNTFQTASPSSNVIYTKEYALSERVTDTGSLIIGYSDLSMTSEEAIKMTDFNNKMLFIYVETTDVPEYNAETGETYTLTCAEKERTSLYVAYDLEAIHSKIIELIKNDPCCTANNALLDYMLLYAAMKACIYNKHYSKADGAIAKYNRLVNKYIYKENGGCNCGNHTA